MPLCANGAERLYLKAIRTYRARTGEDEDESPCTQQCYGRYKLRSELESSDTSDDRFVGDFTCSSLQKG